VGGRGEEAEEQDGGEKEGPATGESGKE
jgi:hypothetical protein